MPNLGGLLAFLAGAGGGYAHTVDDRDVRDRQNRLDAQARQQQQFSNGLQSAQFGLAARQQGFTPQNTPALDAVRAAATATPPMEGGWALKALADAAQTRGTVQGPGGEAYGYNPLTDPDVQQRAAQRTATLGAQDFQSGEADKGRTFEAKQGSALAALRAAAELKLSGVQHGQRMEEIGAQNAGELDRARVAAGLRAPGSDGQIKAGAMVPKAVAADQLLSHINTPGTWANWWNAVTPNKWHSDEGQAWQNASDQFINAILRPESGASITKDEVEQARRQYIPLPGDGPQVLAQKAAARQLAIQQTQSMSGHAAPGGAPAAPLSYDEIVKTYTLTPRR